MKPWMRWLPRALVLALAFACGSCSAWWSASPSPTFYSGDRIKIPHARHAKAKVECLACHESLYDATSLDGNFRPPEAKCLECHRDEKDRGNCAFCHTDPKRPAPYPKRSHELSLSHAAHIERTQEDCSRCHAALPEPLRTAALAPTMQSCLGCHEHQADYDQGRCAKCHKDLTHFPLAPIGSFSHGNDFVHTHGASARSSVDTCAECHEQTFCSDCHARTVSLKVELKASERVEADFIHRNDFLSRHSIEAKGDEALCRRCHGQSFCQDCHTSQNLTPVAAAPRSPHPPGYAFPGPNSHGPAARLDIASCQVCHDQGKASNCVSCHRPGAIGGNPHPAGYTDHHPHSEIRTNAMCLYCHE